MTLTRRSTRQDTAARLAVGVVLGYLLTASAQAALAAGLALVMTRADAVWLGTMLILPLFPASLVYAFGAHAPRRASMHLIGAALTLGVVRWLLP